MTDVGAGSGGERVLVTGAAGFVGAALARDLASSRSVRTACRRGASGPGAFNVGDLGPDTDWRAALEGIDVVVHLAGPAHSNFPPELLRRAIVQGTESLVEQAARAGVKRFVFASSIHACAKRTEGAPLAETTPAAPTDAYGSAKREAERIVLARPALTPVVLRPPLIHAANAKGNFARLLRLLDSAWPLPLGGIRNRRSIISLASFSAAIAAVLRTPGVSGLFHVCDEPSVSTSEMAALLRQGMQRPAVLFTLPGLSVAAPAALVESLEVDGRLFRASFGYAGMDTREALIACGQQWAADR